MIDNANMSNLIYAVKPALYVEYFYGMFRFKIINDKLQKIEIKAKTVILIQSVILPTLFILLLVNRYISSTVYLDSVVDIIDIWPQIFIILDYIIYTNITSLLHGDCNMRLFRNLSQIDHTLNINNVLYRKTRFICIVTAVSLLMCYVTYTIVTKVRFEYLDFILELVLSLASFLTDFEVCFFCALVHMVEIRLKIVNNQLVRIVDENTMNSYQVYTIAMKSKEDFYNPMMMKRVNIIDLAFIYNLIGETYSCINKVFSFHIFMIMVINFSYMIISIWTSVYAYKNTTQEDEIISTSLSIIWTVWCLIELTSVCYVCNNVLATRRKTYALVIKIIIDYNFSTKLRRQAKSFLTLLEAWPLRIMVCDMFCVDITLILKYLSICTTYLIIMLQISHFL